LIYQNFDISKLDLYSPFYNASAANCSNMTNNSASIANGSNTTNNSVIEVFYFVAGLEEVNTYSIGSNVETIEINGNGNYAGWKKSIIIQLDRM